MKIIILSACLYLLCPFYASSASANSASGKSVAIISKKGILVGKWKFVDARCTDNRALTEEEKTIIQNTKSTENFREFTTDGTLIDYAGDLEIMGTTCSLKSTMPYRIHSNSSDMAKAILQTTEPPSDPISSSFLQVMSRIKTEEYPIVEVSCENGNAEVEEMLRSSYKLSAKFEDQGFLPLAIWDEGQDGFKKRVLFYLSHPLNGIGNFRCGEEEHLISMFEEA